MKGNSLGLHLVIVEVTGICNRRCSHCYLQPEGGEEERIDRVALDLVVNEICRLRVPFVTLAGGEPLIIGASLFEIASELSRCDSQVTLATNGTLVPRFNGEQYRVFSRI